MASSAPINAPASSAVGALAEIRTTRPSMPRARKAMVGLVCVSTRPAMRSDSADSDVPQVLRLRERIVPRSPDRSSRWGTTAEATMCCISWGTPGTAYTTLSPTGQSRPGAVPLGLGIASPPFGTSAWRRLLAGIARPRDMNISRMASARSSRRSSAVPITSAIPSRVMSSWVGPSPPQTMTASASVRSERSVSTTRAWLSPTWTWR